MSANAQTTSYYVRTVYETVDKAGTGLANIGKQADVTAKRVDRLKKSVFDFNQAFDATSKIKMGFDKLVKGPLLDFNAQMEQSRITMGGMMRLNLGGEFEKHFSKATSMVEEFQQIAKVSVGTTQDFVQMATMITRPITQAKLSMEDLRDITQGAVIASRAFGIQAEVAALDIEQALMGTLTKRDRFTRALIEPLGLDTEAFNKLDAQQRAGVLKGVLSQPAIMEMAKAQEKSFDGVTSTLQDNLQMAIGKVGLPLFQKVTAEVQRWNTWIEANGDRIEKFSDKLATSLTDAFTFIKDVASFFVENSDTLILIAKGLIAYKAGQMLAGVGGRIGGGLSAGKDFLGRLAAGNNSIGQLAGTASQATSTLGAFANVLGKTLPVLGGLVAVGSILHSQWKQRGKEQEQERSKLMFASGRSFENATTVQQLRAEQDRLRGIERGSNIAGLRRDQQRAGRALTPLETAQLKDVEGKLRLAMPAQETFDQELAKYLLAQGVFTDKLKVDNKKLLTLQNSVAKLGIGDLDAFYGAVTDLENRLGTSGIARLLGDQPTEDKADDALAERERMWAAMQENLKGMAKTGTKVTINKVEVAALDPDRFIHGIARAAERFNRNPTQARAALRGGM